MQPEFKTAVEQIKELNWESLDPQQLHRLMYISQVAAREFAEALRITVQEYPEDPKLRQMANGELQTDNLAFGKYNMRGDHADFLTYFLMASDFIPDESLERAGNDYTEYCRSLDAKTRAMTIFSREHELGGVFERILKNEHWDSDELKAFKYYLERHISLDTDEGGHADLIDEYPIDDAILGFWETRLNLYRVIPELFEV